MSVECRIEALHQPELAATIRRRARAWLAPLNERWRIDVSPSAASDRWMVRIQRETGEDVALFDAPADQLLDQLQEQLRVLVARAGRDSVSRLPGIYARAYAKSDSPVGPGPYVKLPVEAVPTGPPPLDVNLEQTAAAPGIQIAPPDAPAPLDRRRRPMRRTEAGLTAVVAAMACTALLVFGWRSLPARPRSPAAPEAAAVSTTAQRSPAPTPPAAPAPRASGMQSQIAAAPPRDAPRAAAGSRASLAVSLPATAGDEERTGSRTPAAAAGTAWMSPRLARLGVRPGWRGSAIGIDDAMLIRDLQQGLGELWVDRLAAKNDVIFLGVDDDADLARIATLQKALRKGGLLWTFYRKGGRISTPNVAATARSAHFAPSKVIAFSATHDAAAFVALDVVK
jgi:hypothetical protein